MQGDTSKMFMEKTEVKEAGIFPKIVVGGLGGRLDVSRTAGGANAEQDD